MNKNVYCTCWTEVLFILLVLYSLSGLDKKKEKLT